MTLWTSKSKPFDEDHAWDLLFQPQGIADQVLEEGITVHTFTISRFGHWIEGCSPQSSPGVWRDSQQCGSGQGLAYITGGEAVHIPAGDPEDIGQAVLEGLINHVAPLSGAPIIVEWSD